VTSPSAAASAAPSKVNNAATAATVPSPIAKAASATTDAITEAKKAVPTSAASPPPPSKVTNAAKATAADVTVPSPVAAAIESIRRANKAAATATAAASTTVTKDASPPTNDSTATVTAAPLELPKTSNNNAPPKTTTTTAANVKPKAIIATKPAQKSKKMIPKSKKASARIKPMRPKAKKKSIKPIIAAPVIPAVTSATNDLPVGTAAPPAAVTKQMAVEEKSKKEAPKAIATPVLAENGAIQDTLSDDNDKNDNVNNDEEDALVLAAEAAAALMDDLPPDAANLDIDDIPLALLDVSAAGANGEFGAATASGEQAVAGTAGGARVRKSSRARTSVNYAEGLTAEDVAAADGGEARPTTANNTENQDNEATTAMARRATRPAYSDEPVNALGCTSQVQTFESKVPEHLEMASSQKEFMDYYYTQEAAGVNEIVGGPRKRNMEEDEEVFEEDEDGQEKKSNSRGDDEKNMSESEGADIKKDDASTTPPEETEELTLKALCSKLKRTNGGRKKRARKKKGDDDPIKPEESEETLAAAQTAAAAAAATLAASTNAAAQNNPPAPVEEATPDGPQVEVINGEIVIAEDSLLRNPTSRTSTALIDAEFGDAVEDVTTTHLGAVQARYDSFTARTKPTRWGVNETRLFFRALRQCGTDFSMMLNFLEGRTRTQLKRKYKMESRKNPRLVDMALDPKMKVKLDLSVFGNNLEIPDEVPTFVAAKGEKREAPVAAKKEPASNDYDSLFKQDDTAAAEEEVVVEEYATGKPMATQPMGNISVSTLKAKGQVPSAKKTAEKVKKKVEEAPAIIPLALFSPTPASSKGKTKAKKARFKVTPKGKKKMKKK